MINSSNGSSTYRKVDIAIPSNRTGLVFQRAYNSNDSRVTPLGPGWTHSYNIRLNNPGDGTRDVIPVGPTGRSDRFTQRPDGSFTSRPGIPSTLVRDQNGRYTSTQEDGTILSFNASGQLTRIEAPDGKTTVLTYSGAQLTTIADPAGRGVLTLSYDKATGRLASGADWMDPPRVVRYTYDDRGRLSSVVDREGQATRYTYQGQTHWLTSITDARGHVALTFRYDEQGRVIAEHDARGEANGREIGVSYQTKPDGSLVTTFRYQPSAFDPQWWTTVADTYDPQGRLVQRDSRPSSTDEPYVQTWVYNANFAITSATRRGGTAPRPTGTPTASADPSVALPGAGDLDPSVAVRSLLAQAIASATDLTYDEVGRLISFAPTAGAAGAMSVGPGSWQMRYDREDRPRFLDQPNPISGSPRLVTEFRYDAVGNLVEVHEPDGGESHYAYDERDSLVQARTSFGLAAEFTYDDRDHLTRVRVAPARGKGEQVADYAFDGLDRLRRVTQYPNWPDTKGAVVTEYNYDDNGKRLAFRTIR